MFRNIIKIGILSSLLITLINCNDTKRMSKKNFSRVWNKFSGMAKGIYNLNLNQTKKKFIPNKSIITTRKLNPNITDYSSRTYTNILLPFED
ncbi:MAG: hypothetical protein GY830_11355 [Bacteroidetes bacterium]|nr:hypothetical protein [Bacteroidota bacterium]